MCVSVHVCVFGCLYSVRFFSIVCDAVMLIGMFVHMHACVCVCFCDQVEVLEKHLNDTK